MHRALALARRGLGRVEPNPMVGCVIVRGARIIGEGYHHRFGGPHAEIEAIRSASTNIRGASAYVTLEPCAHHGKTPPCTEALIRAGVKRVIAAMKDQGALVGGRGFRHLRAVGVEVGVGCMRDEARRLNAAYLTRVEQHRPYVLLKWAQSLDGQISTPNGTSQAISGPAASRWVHRLRARVDGILVGVGTVLADDPRLTARGVAIRRVAARIVLDSRLRTPLGCRLVRTARRVPTLVMTTRSALRGKRPHARSLQEAGVEIQACRGTAGRVALDDVLHKLGVLAMTNVMVEGGGTVLTQFLRSGLADEIFVFVAPRVIGGNASPIAFDPVATGYPSITTQRVGTDALYHIRFRG